jgi:putative thymidine phosphorylase
LKLKIKQLKFLTGRPVCMIHETTAKKMSLHVGNRVLIRYKNKKIISIIDTVSEIITPNQIAVSEEILEHLSLKDKDIVDVELTEHPRSISLIKKKLKGKHLTKQEITEIISDISNNALTEIEVAFFIAAVFMHDMSFEETKDLIDAMVKSGNQMKLEGKVIDKHCIGGIAGNRTTPLVVSICAAAGLTFPKTSSRAITSASGTADVLETVSRVDFSVKEIKQIIKKTNACMVWGGALGLAPVDDKIIKIERMVNLDSTAQLLASILSKKISVGSHYILIDIPFGRSAKVSKEKAEELKHKFTKLGPKFGLRIEVVLTDGSEPIGRGIGPVLEMKDILKIFKREPDAPKDLEKKSLMLSGILLEMAGKTENKPGLDLAREILDSGKAFEKFKQIIEAQEGRLSSFPGPKYSFTVKAEKNIKIKHYDNQLINQIARFAGCPEDKAAGIYLYKKKGEVAQKDQPLFTIYTVSEEKLRQAKNLYIKLKKRVVEFERI